MSSQYSPLAKLLWFETKFWLSKVRLFKLSVLAVTFIELLIVGYSDIKSSLFDDDGLLPSNWIFLAQHERTVIILIVVILFFLSWALDSLQKSEELNDLRVAVREYIIQSVNQDLTDLVAQLKSRFQLSDDVRASIWLPLREGSLSWGLHMVCRTENIQERELNASFDFDEGVLGQAFLGASNESTVNFLDVSTSNSLPQSYTPLSQGNKLFIEKDIKGVAVLYLRHKGHIGALLALDTTKISDLSALQDIGLHSDIAHWMIPQLRTTDLIWRDYHRV
jgi:hypothetical protein